MPRPVRAPPVSSPTTCAVNGYSEQWLRRGFPWVYPAELTADASRSAPAPGATVRIVSAKGECLGAGIADDGWIAIRRFRADDGPIDAALIAQKLAQALALRRAAMPPDSLPPLTTAWRLVHGENDAMPGVRVDLYGSHAVISLDSPSLQPLLPLLLDALRRLLPVETASLVWRPDPRDKSRTLPAPPPLLGTPPDSLIVQERGVKVMCFPAQSKDWGVFPDMRESRRFLEPIWPGKRLLNLFSYTGLFSVAAAVHGAAEVVSVDLSPRYLDTARANFALNGLDARIADGSLSAEFLAEDAFKALDRFRRQRRTFDVVIADPPGHSHSDGGAWSGEKDYPRLVAAALAVLAPGGLLVACSNLGSISPKTFQGFLEDGSKRAGRRLLVLHEGGAAADFPAALDFPEGRYLKCWVCAAP